MISESDPCLCRREDHRRSTYTRFCTSLVTKEDINCFIGCLLILSINHIRSYRQVLDRKSSQFMSRLLDLMS